MRKLRVAVQMDPFERLEPETDSTISMMRSAHARGHDILVYAPDNLRLESRVRDTRILARGARVMHWNDDAALPRLAAPDDHELAGYDVLLMRQDPPYDMAYVTATSLLEFLPPHVLCVNHPRAVRDAPEKIFIARYPHLMPPTLISRDLAAIEAFRAAHGTLIMKPLYGFGADAVQLLRLEDDAAAIAAYRAAQNGLPFIAQKFLPQVSGGDKRILLLDGQILGAVNRVPLQGSFLANLHAGGQAMAAQVTEKEEALLAPFAATLRDMGVFLAGVDVIGDYVTEINVTCPSALLEADAVNGLTGAARLEEKFWDALEAKFVMR